MKHRSNYSIFGGFGGGSGRAGKAKGIKQPLSQSDLEKAYRKLLVDNQVLVESNQRLLERVERAEQGLSESPAARQLIRAQRDALADRSRKLRESQYANQSLQRENKRLAEKKRALKEKLSRVAAEKAPLAEQLDASQREVAELREQLAERRKELALLTDRYYQLQSKLDPALSADRVIKAEF